MDIHVPAEFNFHCPEGDHLGTCLDFSYITKQTQEGVQDFIRARFNIPALSNEREIMVVGRNFVPSMAKGSQLRTVLECWLGAEFIKEHSRKGSFAFDQLRGVKALVTVQHISNEGHSKPFVHLLGLQPAHLYEGEKS